MKRKTVVIGLLGTVLDAAKRDRWNKWRPTVSLCQHENLLVDRLELLHQDKFQRLADIVLRDIQDVSPETQVRSNIVEFDDPWDFEEVYSQLHDFAKNYPFDPEKEDYLIHITTGTHVAQICLFLLTEAHYLPGKLLQTSPPKRYRMSTPGNFSVIDLDLSRYDHIASRFNQEIHNDLSFLKRGIETRNARFNTLIEQIERVAVRSTAPLLLTGPTGAGKSCLARQIYELKKIRHQLSGPFVEVNCATLRGDAAMSSLFGHVKGAFTGAVKDRPGLLKTADGGLLFLDEVGELGTDEQAMLLRALEEKLFLPVGADHETESSFQLICGSNKNLRTETEKGQFRDDLLARINLWTFQMPGLKDRPEDIEPNLEYELEQFANNTGTHVTFNKEARELFLKFATSEDALWLGNFRDLNGAIIRMATLAPGGRITSEEVREQITRLNNDWLKEEKDSVLHHVLGKTRTQELDLFDRVQLAEVIKICRNCKTLSEAGRKLFAISRTDKAKSNDADRLSKYLAKFALTFQEL